MSQPSTPLDPFLHMEQEPFARQFDAFDYFANFDSFDNSDNFDNFDSFNLDTGNASDLSSFDFTPTPEVHDFPAYPTPSPNSTQPYPLHLGPRRRSLSHSDADRLPVPHPTFIRLQAPRGRPLAPSPPTDARTRRRTHTRSSSNNQTHNLLHRCRGTPLTSSHWTDMLPTSIGTPLHTPRASPHPHLHSRSDGVVFQRMRDPRALAASRRIIEIGALGVQKHTHNPVDEQRRLADAIDEVEAYLARGGVDEGVARACGVLRGALAGGAGVVVHADAAMHSLEVEAEALGPADDNLMAMLMRENECFEG